MVKPAPYPPARGDVVWLHFNPQAGSEQAGRRPALVLSPAAYNGRVGLAVVCPITNQAKGYSFEVPIPPGLGVSGVVLTDHVKNLDWRARNATFIDGVPQAVLDEVVAKLTTLIT